MKKVATMLLLAISVTFSATVLVHAGDPQLPPGPPPPCTEECRHALVAEPQTTLPVKFRVQLLLALLSVWSH